MMERIGLLQLAGQDVTIVGPDIEVGQQAPAFTLRAKDWSVVDVLQATEGKVRIIAAVPSLSTGVCETETKRFNEEAAALDPDIAIVTVSTDLPFTLNNWCAANGIERVTLYSDAYDTNFGEAYGTLIKERRILRRAVFVVDRAGKVVYADYMKALGDQPDYASVLAAAQAALGA
ncbi:MAG: thiol peroxidase [Anaerolineales bacterium]|jgi:thiol peroxidase|nr:thiol peroxidase [Anaerolineales bacterium]MCW5839140.1 thiol peroxidase [Anaerolineales bacterium]MCW5888065.1 thiol peroxidase [Anaerolineales bacterium]